MARITIKNKVLNTAAIIAILCVPFLYSGLFTWAYSDPINHLNNLPAAIVNNDAGRDVPADRALSGKPEHFALGKDIVNELMESNESFGWSVVNQQEANQGLEDGKFFAILVLPEDLSTSVAKLGTNDAQHAVRSKITIETNDAVSYTAGTFASAVGDAVQISVNKAAAKGYISGVLGSFNEIANNLGQASDGASKLQDGAVQLIDGTGKLQAGTTGLTTGITTLKDGADALAHGTTLLSTNLKTAADSASKLGDGQQALTAGATKANEGMTGIIKGIDATSAGSSALANGLDQLASQANALPASTKQLAEGAKGLANGSIGMGSGLNATHNGVKELSTGLGSLREATAQMPEQTKALAAGAAQVANGVQQVASQSQDANTIVQLVGAKVAQCTKNPMSDPAGCKSVAGMLGASGSQALAKLAASNASGGANAMAQLVQGAHALQEGNAKLAEHSTALAQGVAGAASGADKLNAGVNQLVSANTKMVSGAKALESGASQLGSAMPAMVGAISKSSEGAKAIYSGSMQLKTGSVELGKALGAIADNSKKLAEGSTALHTGLVELGKGADTATNGATQLSAGLTTAKEGSIEVNSGITTLQQGLNSAQSGANELATKLNDGKEKLPSYTDDSRDHVADIAAQPVEIDKQRMNPVTNNGAGFAPFVITLSLWIGGMSLFFLFPAVDKRRKREAWWKSATRPMMITTLLGLGQAAIVVLGMKLILDISATTVSSLLIIGLLTSLAFVYTNQALLAVFGYRGRFVSLMLMIVQITSMGGTYPVQTAPGFFQTMHELLPMTYISNIIRSLIAGGTISILPAVLWIFALMVFAVCTVFAVAWVRRDRLAYEDPLTDYLPNERTSELGQMLPDSLLES